MGPADLAAARRRRQALFRMGLMACFLLLLLEARTAPPERGSSAGSTGGAGAFGTRGGGSASGAGLHDIRTISPGAKVGGGAGGGKGAGGKGKNGNNPRVEEELLAPRLKRISNLLREVAESGSDASAAAGVADKASQFPRNVTGFYRGEWDSRMFVVDDGEAEADASRRRWLSELATATATTTAADGAGTGNDGSGEAGGESDASTGKGKGGKNNKGGGKKNKNKSNQPRRANRSSWLATHSSPRATVTRTTTRTESRSLTQRTGRFIMQLRMDTLPQIPEMSVVSGFVRLYGDLHETAQWLFLTTLQGVYLPESGILLLVSNAKREHIFLGIADTTAAASNGATYGNGRPTGASASSPSATRTNDLHFAPGAGAVIDTRTTRIGRGGPGSTTRVGGVGQRRLQGDTNTEEFGWSVNLHALETFLQDRLGTGAKAGSVLAGRAGVEGMMGMQSRAHAGHVFAAMARRSWNLLMDGGWWRDKRAQPDDEDVTSATRMLTAAGAGTAGSFGLHDARPSALADMDSNEALFNDFPHWLDHDVRRLTPRQLDEDGTADSEPEESRSPTMRGMHTLSPSQLDAEARNVDGSVSSSSAPAAQQQPQTLAQAGGWQELPLALLAEGANASVMVPKSTESYFLVPLLPPGDWVRSVRASYLAQRCAVQLDLAVAPDRRRLSLESATGATGTDVLLGVDTATDGAETRGDGSSSFSSSPAHRFRRAIAEQHMAQEAAAEKFRTENGKVLTDGGSSALQKGKQAPLGPGTAVSGPMPSALARVSTVAGRMRIPDCGMQEGTVKADAFHINWDAARAKALVYSVIATLLCVVQVVVIVLQLNHSRNQAQGSRVSMISIGWHAVHDSLLCAVHLMMCALLQPLFSVLISIVLLKLIVFTVFEMRYLVMIYQQRYSQQLAEQGFNSVRQQLAMLQARFYLGLFGAVMAMYVLNGHINIIFFLLFSFWVPQIAWNAYMDSRSALHPYFLWGFSLTKLFIPLYFFGCPKAFMHYFAVYGMSSSACVIAVVWVIVQAYIVTLQDKYGSRFFIPKQFLPPKYDYERRIPPAVLQRLHHTHVHAQDGTGGAGENANQPDGGTGARSGAGGGGGGGGGDDPVRTTAAVMPMAAVEPSHGLGGIDSAGRVGGASTNEEHAVGETELVARHRPQAAAAAGVAAAATEAGHDVETGGLVECVICYVAIDPNNQRYMLTPCDHLFHYECLERWLNIRLDCPICRFPCPTP